MSKKQRGNAGKRKFRWRGPYEVRSTKGGGLAVAETTPVVPPPPRVIGTTLAEYLAARRKPAASTPELVAAGT